MLEGFLLNSACVTLQNHWLLFSKFCFPLHALVAYLNVAQRIPPCRRKTLIQDSTYPPVSVQNIASAFHVDISGNAGTTDTQMTFSQIPQLYRFKVMQQTLITNKCVYPLCLHTKWKTIKWRKWSKQWHISSHMLTFQGMHNRRVNVAFWQMFQHKLSEYMRFTHMLQNFVQVRTFFKLFFWIALYGLAFHVS